MLRSTIIVGFFILQCQNNPVTSNSFALLARSAYFVDKSEMIKVFFNPDKAIYHFITCPPGFGKSVNLQMLKLFANIVVDQNGTEVNYTRTEAFEVFKDLKIVKSNQGSDFISRHMAQHPIVHLELATNQSISNITNGDDVVTYLNERLSTCFKDFEWLLQIPKEEFVRRSGSDSVLGSGEILFLKKLQQRNLNESEAVGGLRSLCKILSSYFDKRVIVLVDQYDHMVNSYTIWNSNRTVSRIYSTINAMLLLAFDNRKFVRNWVIAGTSSMPFRGSHLTFSNSNHHSFLNEHLFTPYFGFTEDEMKKLFTKFECSMEEKIDIKEYYNGYVTRGTRTSLYNPNSIAKYFEARNAAGRKRMSTALKSYWHIGYEKDFLLTILKNLPGFKTDLKKLITHDSISFKLTKNFFNKDLRVFHDLKITNKHFYIKHYNLAMSFLFERGYVVPTLKEINEYKLPNNEITMKLDNVLEEFKDKRLKKVVGVDYSLIDLSLYEDDESAN